MSFDLTSIHPEIIGVPLVAVIYWLLLRRRRRTPKQG